MEITQSSKNPLEAPTVEVGTSRRGGVATQPGMLQLGASGDASAVHQDFNKNTSGKKQRYKKRSRTKSDGSESLSDIDDSEIVGYLNNKKEMHLKRMLWEAMNKEHVKVKKQKPATETKKTTTARKAVKTTEKLEQQKRSSRINYDALRILSDDMEQGCGTAPDVDLILDSWRITIHRTKALPHPKCKDLKMPILMMMMMMMMMKINIRSLVAKMMLYTVIIVMRCLTGMKMNITKISISGTRLETAGNHGF